MGRVWNGMDQRRVYLDSSRTEMDVGVVVKRNKGVEGIGSC